jgi:hypothetical protein
MHKHMMNIDHLRFTLKYIINGKIIIKESQAASN